MSGQPGSFQPRGEDWIGREIQEIKAKIQRLEAANVFGLTGIVPKDGGTDLDGFVNINGPLEVNGDAAINGPLEVNGDSVFNGAMSITGALNLPAGIIGNDALTSPLSPQTAHADVSDFALNTGPNVEMVRATVAVPAGYTKALVMASASMGNRNTTGVVDDMYIDCRINGLVSGWSSQTAVMAGKVGFVVNIGTSLLEGLSGSFYIAANASSGSSAWAINGAAAINVDAIVMFLR